MIGPFHDVRLPESLSVGAITTWHTASKITPLASGQEHRQALWSGVRRSFDIGRGILDESLLQDLITFFIARNGPVFGFRFKEAQDFKSCALKQSPSPFDQTLGVGDGRTRHFYLKKSYGAAQRRIFKPVLERLSLSIDGRVLGPEAFGFDQGQVVLETPPALGAVVQAGFEFDVPVRFAHETLEVAWDQWESHGVKGVRLMELGGIYVA